MLFKIYQIEQTVLKARPEPFTMEQSSSRPHFSLNLREDDTVTQQEESDLDFARKLQEEEDLLTSQILQTCDENNASSKYTITYPINV